MAQNAPRETHVLTESAEARLLFAMMENHAPQTHVTRMTAVFTPRNLETAAMAMHVRLASPAPLRANALEACLLRAMMTTFVRRTPVLQ